MGELEDRAEPPMGVLAAVGADGVFDVHDVLHFAVARQLDGDDVDAERQIIDVRVLFDVAVYGDEEFARFGACDRERGHAGIGASPRAYFDEDDGIAIEGDEIDFAIGGAELASNDPVTLRFEMRGRGAFAEVAEVLGFCGHRA